MQIKDIKNDTCGIYCIQCVKTNKRYVGSSVNIKKRLYYHLNRLRNNKHGNIYLQNAWNKYKEESFIYCILKKCSPKNLTKNEEFFIREQGEFNLTKIVDRKNQLNKLTKQKISNKLKGVKKSNEHANNIKEAQKIIVHQYTLKGDYVKSFSGLSEVEEKLGISRGDICSCANNKRKKSAGGFLWSYLKQDKINSYKRKPKKEHFVDKRSKTIIFTSEDEVLIFKSWKLACVYFNKTHNHICQYYRKNLKFLKKYKIDLIKSDKLLETPNKDNQQPI